MSAPGPLITVAELRDALHSPHPPLLLDVRWELATGPRSDAYLARHIPGARFVDLDRDLAAPPARPGGRHPLPSVGALERSLRRLGVSRGIPLVAYDDSGGLPAARAWWVLRDAGHPDVRVLDGGLAAWAAAGGRLVAGEEPAPEPGDFAPVLGHLPALDADGAAARAADPTTGLLDVRAPERFRGEQEPIDPVAGHIPGARNLPISELVGSDGRVRGAAEIAAALVRAGVSPGSEKADGTVGVYCGSGITAALAVLALARAEIPSALYPGSWSDWITDPSRPVATGE